MHTKTDRSPHKGASGLTRIVRALGHFARSLAIAYRHESAVRQELLLSAVAFPLAMLLPESLIASAVPILSTGLVLVIELLNSAVEAAVDRISPEDHVFAMRAKDLGSAAVFVSLLICG